uniref:DNA primase/polymerase bifunctional N-terminal domain-containing protein n=1 Tax=Magnetococcus massalia (strain MO-1) TaxID=451514 RepID=A0A1S7LM45_MAGMO|nr:Protein of unknown function. P-loop containing nucleoside triphosphate hydrolases [Candidatus Magnetococcus massalia]
MANLKEVDRPLRTQGNDHNPKLNRSGDYRKMKKTSTQTIFFNPINVLDKLSSTGFQEDLIPIIPPGAQISAKTKIGHDHCGKTPGKMLSDGYCGFSDWTNHYASKSDIELWKKDPHAGVGVICRNIVGIDIDIVDEDLADKIAQLVTDIFGSAPKRIGNAPKVLFAYRWPSDDRLKKIRVPFEFNGEKHAVEILGHKQQFVAYGIHPKTLKPYEWVGGDLASVGMNGLPLVDREKLDSFLKELNVILNQQGAIIPSKNKGNNATSSVGQRYPIGDQHLRAANAQDAVNALRSIPIEDLDYDEWVKMIAAFKGAVGGDEAYYPYLKEWCLEYAENTPEQIRSKWESIHDSEVGATCVFNRAKRDGWVSSDIPEWVSELNAEFAVVHDNGSTMVMRIRRDAVTKETSISLIPFQDFRGMFPQKIHEAGKNIPKGAAWLTHPQRREYLDGLVFAPGKNVSGDQFNLWSGWGIPPVSGDCHLIKAHIRDVICAGSSDLYEYVMGWLANMVQNPNEPGQTILVLMSGQGTGKGVFVDYIGRMLGKHYQHIHDSDHLTGRFTGHLEQTILLFADEALFAKDMRAMNKLKSLATERKITIEAKHKPPKLVNSCLHIIMASNVSHVANLDHDDRRYAILDVSDHRVSEHTYFDKLVAEKNGLGPSALLNELLQWDLSSFDVRNIPITKGHLDQKLKSLSGVHAWLFDCLVEGVIADKEWKCQSFEIAKNNVYTNYSDKIHSPKFWNTHGMRSEFWKTVKSWSGAQEGARAASDLVEGRQRQVKFPPLTKARERFAEMIGYPSLNWETDI